MKIKKMLEVMDKFSQGMKVEHRYKNEPSNDWSTCSDPVWNWLKVDYRIAKPNPKCKRAVSFPDNIEVVEYTDDIRVALLDANIMLDFSE